MLLFWMHPGGQPAWFYALYWLIPIAAALKYNDKLVTKAIGATFTAHAIGSIAYLYAFNLGPEVWLALIPVVAIERLLFTSGIITSYVMLNTVLDRMKAIVPQKLVSIDPRYVIGKEFFRIRA